MKHYALALVNKTTGNIEHIAVSDGPIEDDKIGTPSNVGTTHQLIRFEFDATPSNGRIVFSGREALNEFEMIGVDAAAKSSPTATVKLKSGMTSASNILVGTQV